MNGHVGETLMLISSEDDHHFPVPEDYSDFVSHIVMEATGE